MHRLVVINSALAIVSALPIAAQSFPPLQRQPVLDAPIPVTNPPIRLVHGARIQFAPGQQTGLYRHPVSVVGIVTESSFIFQPQGEPVRTIKVGNSFFKPAGKTIFHCDNASHTQSAAIVAYYLTDSKYRSLIELMKK